MQSKEKRQGQLATLKKVLHYMKHYIPLLVLSIILATVSVALTLYFPIITGKAIDLILAKGKVDFAGRDRDLNYGSGTVGYEYGEQPYDL